MQPLCASVLQALSGFSRPSSASLAVFVSAYVALCAFYITSILMQRAAQIFIVNYGCFLAPPDWRVPYATFLEHLRLMNGAGSDDSSIDFQRMILDRSGISELSFLPPSSHHLPPRADISSARFESETTLFGAIDDLLASVDVKPSQIGVLIVNCSIFNPVPSIATMIINKYKLPVEVKSYCISGMGCAAGLIALDLAKRLLSVHPRTYALVVSTENVTENFYGGNQRSMLVSNCLFRAGASAVLVSNKWGDRRKSKYRILHTARSQMAALDMAYRSVFQEEDEQGTVGVALSKELMQSAGIALEHNLRMLGPRILPAWEIIFFTASVVRRKLKPRGYGAGAGAGTKQPYIPNFKRIFNHICVHAGGKAVVKAVERSLQIPPSMTESSYMTLYRFGNVSSASVWYGLAYEEGKGRVKRGNKVWQIGLGSGFKCCSAVLQALQSMDSSICSACWTDTITSLPLPVRPPDCPDSQAPP